MYIIGMVGSFGSSCSYIRDIICQEKQYEYVSLSDILRNSYKNEHGTEPNRRQLQDYGDKMREEHGNDFLAKKAKEHIDKNRNKNFVVDSIRNPHEVDFLRKEYAKVFLFGIFADRDVRWQRVKSKPPYFGQEFLFDEDDARDKDGKTVFGQRVTDTFAMADVVISNNKNFSYENDEKRNFQYKVIEKIDLIEGNMQFVPKPDEAYMAMAYAVSLRSSCLKRKVGAVIVDDFGNVFSSGYNEAPLAESSCQVIYSGCYRDILRKEFKESLNCSGCDSEAQKLIYDNFKERFKNLDYCRALHAEENAILNVARTGASNVLNISKLYTTTYPCNLCANKIVQVGIKAIVYFEPYPMKDAKEIFREHKIVQIPFEGVTYNGYFKLKEGVVE